MRASAGFVLLVLAGCAAPSPGASIRADLAARAVTFGDPFVVTDISPPGFARATGVDLVRLETHGRSSGASALRGAVWAVARDRVRILGFVESMVAVDFDADGVPELVFVSHTPDEPRAVCVLERRGSRLRFHWGFLLGRSAGPELEVRAEAAGGAVVLAPGGAPVARVGRNAAGDFCATLTEAGAGMSGLRVETILSVEELELPAP